MGITSSLNSGKWTELASEGCTGLISGSWGFKGLVQIVAPAPCRWTSDIHPGRAEKKGNLPACLGV